MIETFAAGRVIVEIGDITESKTDAIVNAANSTLLGGGGVDGAIHAKGGPEILAECREIRRTRFPDGLPTGSAVITNAGKLPSGYVIHTVGPVYGDDRANQAAQLASCYRNSLEIAREFRLNSIAFPSISTGAFGYPSSEAAQISSAAIRSFLEEFPSIVSIRLVFFSVRDSETFLRNHAF